VKPSVSVPSAPAPTATTLIDIVCGAGEAAKDGTKVEVKYVGLLYKDGKEFDSSWSRGDTFPVTLGGGVIPGFTKGITGMKVGGRREVVIPPTDGYGDQANGAIPANSTLIFLIDLVKIQKPAPVVPCTPSGSGTTDLTKKPAVTVPKAAAPAETTVIDIVCGTGKQADEGSAVEVKYLGVLYADGKEFDSSWSRGNDSTLPFTVGSGVIPGFSIGVTGMKVGGRREIIIPAKDGYGPDGQPPTIPGGATLVFVIDLVTVS
jgi:FKBP-type peptidyl-prolyl cis-trans isomerase